MLKIFTLLLQEILTFNRQIDCTPFSSERENTVQQWECKFNSALVAAQTRHLKGCKRLTQSEIDNKCVFKKQIHFVII